jgi:hypothetical protein
VRERESLISISNNNDDDLHQLSIHFGAVRYHGSNKKPSNEMMIKNTNERLMKKTLK